uniref:Uncharacterized protein n=1 Tax=Arion vulgaris TaxID=1028688 RepID=A0A0B6XYP6_9EUPU
MSHHPNMADLHLKRSNMTDHPNNLTYQHGRPSQHGKPSSQHGRPSQHNRPFQHSGPHFNMECLLIAHSFINLSETKM